MASSGSSSPGERPKPQGTWAARDVAEPTGTPVTNMNNYSNTETINNDNHNINTGSNGNLPVLVGYASSDEDDLTPDSLPSLVESTPRQDAGAATAGAAPAQPLRFEDMGRQAQMAYLVNNFNSVEFLQMTLDRANWEGEMRQAAFRRVVADAGVFKVLLDHYLLITLNP